MLALTQVDASLLKAFGDAESPPPPPPPPPSTEEQAASEASSGGKAVQKKKALEASLRTSVGGLEAQLEAIVRRVLASRADPEAARKLGVSHVRGILLSGPPGCGKTLLARELARSLGAREPQVVNGPEILDKCVQTFASSPHILLHLLLSTSPHPLLNLSPPPRVR